MLKRLEIKNVALIDNAEIEFTDGLNVLSGETGSGKSVVLESINFVLGAKADKSMIRYGTEECSVTAIFSCPKVVESLLDELGIESDDELIIKRRFSVDGKGFIKVNGENVTAGMLKSISSHLVDVHGQSEHYFLLNESNQLEVLDKYSGKELLNEKEQLKPLIDRAKDIEKKLKELGGNETERAIRQDVLKYQIEEIENAELKDGEEDELISLRQKIKNGEKIIQALSQCRELIGGDNQSGDMLRTCQKSLSSITHIDGKYEELYGVLDGILQELNDVESRMDDYIEEMDFDEEEADRVELRLELIGKLKKKYGNSINDINDFLQKAKEEYEILLNFDKNSEQLLQDKGKLDKEIALHYAKITEIRKEKAEDFAKKVTLELSELAMKNCSFKVEFLGKDYNNYYNDNGVDEIKFLFTANLGEPLKEMSKVISGGEMSRFMLGMKSVICDLQDISTFIFDEIDTGISGNTAQVVAEKFAKISTKKQIIAISHLPQITAMSDTSVLIYKLEDGTKTTTNVKVLGATEKLSETVRLVGGNMESVSAINHAKEMIEIAKEYKNKL